MASMRSENNHVKAVAALSITVIFHRYSKTPHIE